MSVNNAMARTAPLVEKALVLSAVGILLYACIQVVEPFIAPTLWALILVLSTWPYYQSLQKKLGGRKGWAALLMTMLILLLIVAPMTLTFNELAGKWHNIGTLISQVDQIKSESPPEWVSEIPWIGKTLETSWQAGTLQSWIEGPKLRLAVTKTGTWLLEHGANLAVAILHALLATLLAGLIYVNGEQAAASIRKFARLAGGNQLVNALETAGQTVRGVSLGVIGTALMHGLIFGSIFAIAHIPAASLLGFICFLLAVVQLGTVWVWLPIGLWLGTHGSEIWSAIIIVTGIATGFLDNLIKPYLIGRSTPMPFILILMGVIGGVMAWGLIGIFLGTSLLAATYSVMTEWFKDIEPKDSGVNKS